MPSLVRRVHGSGEEDGDVKILRQLTTTMTASNIDDQKN